MMLAIQIAAEINHRWSELEKLSGVDRLHVLEMLVERNVLATGPYSSSSYVPTYEGVSEFDTRPSVDDEDQR